MGEIPRLKTVVAFLGKSWSLRAYEEDISTDTSKD